VTVAKRSRDLPDEIEQASVLSPLNRPCLTESGPLSCWCQLTRPEHPGIPLRDPVIRPDIDYQAAPVGPLGGEVRRMPPGLAVLVAPVQPERLRGDARDTRVEVHRHSVVAFQPRLEAHVAPGSRRPPPPREMTGALRPTEDDALTVKNATAGCAHLERLHKHVRSFAKIMAQRRGKELPAWLDAVEADDLSELRSLAAGMRRDLPAVINGLTLEHSSGAVEGNVTRVKRLKRDGYGRANFDLLRARILLAALADVT